MELGIGSNLIAQWGAVGILVSALMTAVVALWKTVGKKDAQILALCNDLREVAQSSVSVNTELVTLIRDRGKV